MHFLFNFKNWAKGALFLTLMLQPVYSEEPHPEKISENRNISWREFIEFHISDQGREGEIKEQLRITTQYYEGIPLIEELIRLKLKSFKEQGGSLENFLPEAIDRAKNFKGLVPFEGALGELKLDLLMFHLMLAALTEKINSFSPHGFPLPHLRLFDFEQETGFILFGTIPLIKELINCRRLILDLALNKMSKKTEWWKPFWDSPEMAAEYYFGSQFAFLKRLSEYLAKGQYPEIKERVLEAITKGYFDADIYKLLPPKDEMSDPIIHLLPKIVQFVPIEAFKEYFQARFGSLDPWDAEMHWVDLHFHKIEALAAVDQSQALEQIEKTEKEIDANLWAYPFSWNYTAWQNKRVEAMERLANWKAKLVLGVEQTQ